jgi:hypothetical protein
MKMRIFSFVAFVLTCASVAVAAAPELKPSPAVCKADLKKWSAQKTETLAIEQLQDRMNEMYACADEAHHHWHSNKRVRAYLDELYRVHTELANRAFDFIERHDLQKQFGEEENGTKTDAKPND